MEKEEKKYYSLDVEEVLRELESSRFGLSELEAQKRIEKFGLNQLPEGKKKSSVTVFLSQFSSPLAGVVLMAMFFSFFVKHVADAFFIAFVVLMNGIVGFVQEMKSEKVLEKLSKSVQFRSKVIREGRKKMVLSRDIAIGDVVEIKSGDKIPADGRIILSHDLKVNEAMLTGEWISVEKNTDIIDDKAVVADRKNMVFMGTIVDDGQALFVITGTGKDTELGKISRLVGQEKETRTPLQEKFYQLSQKMVLFILGAVLIFAVAYFLRGETLYNVFMVSIALVVSAVPEGLLPAITVVLILAMRRLSKQKALVRRLDATEGMGSVSVICMDKTGTLTLGKMQVSHIITGASELLKEKGDLDDIYDPHVANAHLRALEIATMVNEAFIENPDDEISEYVVRGGHTDKALLLAGISAGIDREKLEKRYRVIDRIPFNSSAKYAASICEYNGSSVVYLLGSPESIIDKSSSLYVDEGNSVHISSTEAQKLFDDVDELSNQGLRLLACAQKEISHEEYAKIKNDHEKLFANMEMVGFIALKDPLRRDAKVSVEKAVKAGIRPIVITGDHKNTVKAIIKELGIKVEENEILEGKDMDAMSDEELFEKVKKTIIFARVIPEHKIRIVKALQKNGEVVAMVGDGVNDAPALKAADIGIAVENGTDIAKEVADIVLLDDNFSVIVTAIEQGRQAKDSIRKILIYLLADDFSELFLFFSTVFMGLPFPLYPAQILWINLVEDGLPNLALTAENDTRGVMERSPEDPKAPLLSAPYKKFMFGVFVVSGLAALLTFYFMNRFSGDIEKTRTVVFALVAFDSLVFAYAIKSFSTSIFSAGTFSNRILNWSIVASFLLLVMGIYAPFMQKLLNTIGMNLLDWGIVSGVSLVEIIILDAYKNRLFGKQGMQQGMQP